MFSVFLEQMIMAGHMRCQYNFAPDSRVLMKVTDDKYRLSKIFNLCTLYHPKGSPHKKEVWFTPI